MTSLLAFGFLLGIRHALEADHIVTVASLASTHRSQRQVVRQGLAWGVGHSLTLLLFAGVVLWLDTLIPEGLATGLEMLVGALMIVLGIDVVRRGRATGQAVPAAFAAPGGDREQLPLRALAMGLIHGMAGSAALILLFVERMNSVLQGLAYVVIFSIGSLAGMLLFSVVISFPLGFTAKNFARFHTGLRLGIGLLTAAIGLVLIVERL
ncbi:urease accessory protein [Exilibacterium tricleocarpae]|uniref:Nickel/cobalt efflux system n=1 Tax=Exilibacterium tricleocarpae TaxID=2591008 RepID=A0A545TFH3_9GAMM|nr:urease accessory protein [Exilibacterium tricleocarpae]TQV75982.1 urease accessory protein [Exilibacterium tricleocarpae]